MDPLQNEDNSETNMTLVILDHTYIVSPCHVSRIPAFIVHHSRHSEACVENGPYLPNEMVTGRLPAGVDDGPLQDDELWNISGELAT